MNPTLKTGWDRQVQPASLNAVRRAITDAAARYAEAYVVVSKGPQDYIQTYHETKGFILEKREGSAEQHYRGNNFAVSPSLAEFPKLWERLLDIGPRRSRHFDDKEIAAAFCAYLENSPYPATIQWQPHKV